MKIDFKKVPSEVENLRQIIATLNTENNCLLSNNNSLRAQNTTLASERENLLSENDLLRYQLKLLKAKRFGRSSEKLNIQIDQLELWIEENDLKTANDQPS